MIIEHDGKRIDTERELRRITGKGRAKYIGVLTHGRHVIESVDDQSFGAYFSCHVVEQFENVPQKHERWIVAHTALGWKTEAEAQGIAGALTHLRDKKVVKIEWES